MNQSPPRIASRMILTGRVQGVGLRPAVARFARRLSLRGHVGNTSAGVEIHVEGPAAIVANFEQELKSHLPAAAEITSFRSTRIKPTGCDSFAIGQVCEQHSHPRDPADSVQTCTTLSARVPLDVVVCGDCLAELKAASNRRHRYPFTSCTECGPRYSILDCMPYEREQTSMETFVQCDRCRRDYECPTARRFHAQTNACAECGPRIWLADVEKNVIARMDEAIVAAASTILGGRIIALRGLGGYQLLVDATSQHAVERLRQRKQRRGKPLAVMVASLGEAHRLARIEEAEGRRWRAPLALLSLLRVEVIRL